jgi:predicted ATP-grasp superfamily ATP-dependent carboligase
MSAMEKTTGLEIIETSSVKTEKPLVIIGLPGVGLVGVISSMLLVD